MAFAPEPNDKAWKVAEAEVPASRPVAPLAILCAIGGVLSPLAFLDWSLLVFPLGTVILAIFAWRQVYRYDPPALGLGSIRFGLILAAFAGIGGPVRLLTFQAYLQSESRPTAEQFLALLREDKPQMAFQLTRDPNVRLPLEDALWAEYALTPEAREQLFWDVIAKDQGERENFEGFVNRIPVRVVLALKDQSRIRYLGTPVAHQRHGRYQVHHLYAVTYDKEAKRRTVVLAIQLERQRLRQTRAADWVVTDIFGPVNPDQYP